MASVNQAELLLLNKETTPQQKEKKDFPRKGFAYVGDSLTAGPVYGQDIPGFAHGGKFITEMVEDFDFVLNSNPSAIVFLGGTNDLKEGLLDAEGVFKNIKKMKKRAKTAKIKMVVCTIPPMGRFLDEKWPAAKANQIKAYVRELNEKIRDAYPDEYIDYNLAMRDKAEGREDYLSAKVNSPDGLHPTDVETMIDAVNAYFDEV